LYSGAEQMEIKEGDLVVFKQGLYAGEEERLIYRMVELNGDRCFIELVNTNMVIRPQSLAMTAELVLYPGSLSFEDNHWSEVAKLLRQN